MVVSVEQEYYRLRQKLDEFKYSEPFRPDSMPLVEHLFHDLVLTTESYKEARDRLDIIDQKYQEAYYQVEPLKKQVQALIEENNLLHKQIIQLVDGRDDAEERLMRHVKKLECKVADLTFLKDHMARQFEQEKLSLERKMDVKSELQMIRDRLNPPHLSSQKTQDYSVLVDPIEPKIDLDSGLRVMTVPVPSVRYDPVMIDMVSLYEKKMETLEQDKKYYENEYKNLADQLNCLNEKCKVRDAEIDRLTKTMETGLSAIIRKSVLDATFNTKGNDGKVGDGKEDELDTLTRLQSQIDYLQDQIGAMDNENSKVKIERNKLIQKLEDEKKAFDEALAKEKDVNAGLLRHVELMERSMKQLEEGLSSQRKSSSQDVRKDYVSSLENHPRNSMERGEQVKVPVTDNCTQTCAIPEKNINDLQAHLDQVSGDKKSLSDELERVLEENKEISGTIQDLQEEVKSLQQMLSTNTQQSSILKQQLQNSKLNEQELRQSYIAKINDQSAHVKELEQKYQKKSEEASSLSQQLSQLILQYKEAQAMETQQHPISASVTPASIPSPLPRTPAPKVDRMVETDQQYKADLEDVANSKSQEEKNEIKNLNVLLGNLYGDKERLEMKLLEVMRNSKVLETDLKETRDKANALQSELSTKEQLFNNLQETLEKVHERRITSDVTLENTSEQLQRLSHDLNHVAHERDILEDSVRELSVELQELRNRIKGFDGERDKLNADLDSKDEQIHDLSVCIEDLIKDVKDNQHTNDSLRQNEMLLNGHIGDQEKEITSLRGQINLLTTERNQLLKDLQEKLDSVRKVESDNRAIARESQVVQEDLNTMIERNTDLEVSHQEMLSKVTFMDDLVRSREQEKEMLMNAYKNLCAENQKLKEALTEAMRDKENLMDKQDDFLKTFDDLTETLQQKTDEYEQMKIALASSEQQTEYLANTLSAAQTQLNDAEGGKEQAIHDLESVRHLAQTFDEGREEARRQIAQLSVEREKLQEAVKQLSLEKDSLLEQLRNEAGNRDRMEKLLIAERGKVMKESQERDTIRLAHEKLLQQLKGTQTEQSDAIYEWQQEKSILTRENEKLAGTVKKLEQIVRDQQDLLSERHQQKQLFKDSQIKEKGPENPLEAVAKPNQDGIEKKILAELEVTKHQLHRYEELLQSKKQEKEKRHLDVSGMVLANDLLSEWQSSNDKLAQEILHRKTVVEDPKSCNNFFSEEKASNDGDSLDMREDPKYLRQVVEQVKRDLRAAFIDSPVNQSFASSTPITNVLSERNNNRIPSASQPPPPNPPQ